MLDGFRRGRHSHRRLLVPREAWEPIDNAHSAARQRADARGFNRQGDTARANEKHAPTKRPPQAGTGSLHQRHSNWFGDLKSTQKLWGIGLLVICYWLLVIGYWYRPSNFSVLSFPNSVWERHLRAKLCFAVGNRVAETLSFPNRVWERENRLGRPTLQFQRFSFSAF